MVDAHGMTKHFGDVSVGIQVLYGIFSVFKAC